MSCNFSSEVSAQVRVSAPGKLVLIGEYVVVEGSTAIAMAVNRRVCATTTDQQTQSPLILAAAREALNLMENTPANVPFMSVDSSMLYESGNKLGLGSSAAVAASTAACTFAAYGADIDSCKPQILIAARNAQRKIQSSRSSGIDVATSVFGGTILFENTGEHPRIEPISLPTGLHLRFVWTKSEASTPKLLAEVERFKASAPDRFKFIMDAMADVVSGFVQACSNGIATLAGSLLGEFGTLMQRLGKESGAGIYTPQIERVCSLAAKYDGWAKPSGAGGGDVVIAAFTDSDAAADFAKQIHEWSEVSMLDLQLDPNGVMLDGCK